MIYEARERELVWARIGSQGHSPLGGAGLLCTSRSLNRPWIRYRNRNENPRAIWQVTPDITKQQFHGFLPSFHE